MLLLIQTYLYKAGPKRVKELSLEAVNIWLHIFIERCPLDGNMDNSDEDYGMDVGLEEMDVDKKPLGEKSRPVTQDDRGRLSHEGKIDNSPLKEQNCHRSVVWKRNVPKILNFRDFEILSGICPI